MQQIVLNVGGMTCGGCVKSVKRALDAQSGVLKSSADLAQGTATVDFDENMTDAGKLIAAVENAGFDACLPD